MIKKAFIVFFFGILSALTAYGIFEMSGIQTTINALMFHFSIQGSDIGETFEIFARDFFPNHSHGELFGALYLVGYSITEEVVKFLFFILAVLLLKPLSTRQVLYTGILIGAGFATAEHFSYETFSWYIFPLRLAGHTLFTAIIAIWYSLGSFARMRWIDDGARSDFISDFLLKWPGFVMGLWIISGLFLAAFFHSFVNLFASTGHYTAVVIELIGWMGVVYFLFSQKSLRPYGKILQEIRLMRELHDIQEALTILQHPQSIDESSRGGLSHFHIKKLRFSRKQVAKK